MPPPWTFLWQRLPGSGCARRAACRLTLTGVTQGLGKLATVGMVSHPLWGDILNIALELGLIAQLNPNLQIFD